MDKRGIQDLKNHLKQLQQDNLVKSNRIAQLEEELLEKSKQQFALDNIVANMPGHIYWKDLEGVYLGCNDKQAKSLGLKSGKDVIGKTDFDLPWGEGFAEKYRKNDLNVIETGRTMLTEEPANVDGQETIVLSQKTPLLHRDGKIIGILGISIDIGKQKTAEKALVVAKDEAERINRSKIQLLNAINQIVRTQLTGVLGIPQLISLESKVSPQLKARLESIYESGDSILPMLKTIYYYLDLEQGRLKILEQNLTLSRLIDTIIKQHYAEAQAKDIHIGLIYDEALPHQVLGDSILVQQILNTLVYNAVRFTQQGRVTIKVSEANKEDNRVWIAITVRDTGIGIAEEKQKHLFDLLELDINEPESAFANVGINLSLAHMIARLLGGELSFTSALGKGSCFKLLLPFKECPDTKPELVLSLGLHLAKERYEFNKERQEVFEAAKFIPKSDAPLINVLIVEDHAINLKVETELLEAIANCDITTASSVAEAMTKLDKHYNLILLDINLPDGSGVEIANAIKQKRLYDAIPIIAVTAHASEEEVNLLTAKGIDCVVDKPITQSKLEDILTYFVYYSINQ